MESLAQLETLCERLYKSHDSAERAYVENTLKCFSVDTNYITQCEYILENTRSSYALLLASSSLLKQVTANRLPLQLRLQIRDHLINYLATRGPKLESFVIGSLVQLLCRVTKVGWFDSDRFKELVKDITIFFNQESHHYEIGLKILNQLIVEMNQSIAELSITQNRKAASSFKDHSLLAIYQISLTSLVKLKSDAQSKLQELALSLSLKCLSFDFIGTYVDETSDEFGTIQLPSSWRPLIEEQSTLQLYFDYYAITDPPHSKEALECLVRIASVRRSLFASNATRLQFLALLMAGTKDILETGKGLGNYDNYSEFCRLLGRFKVNYQLSELVSMEGYTTWISLIADFTVKSLESWQWASDSVYFLLGLWSRMVTSVPFLKNDLPVHLDQFVPKILEGFISSRFDCAQDGEDDGSEDILDNVELLHDQIDFFPRLCSFQYESCGAFVMKIMDPILEAYVEGTKFQDQVDTSKLAVTENKLAWLVHIIASILKTRQFSGSSGGSQEEIDAELSARVIQLISVMDSGSYCKRYGELSRHRLDLAVLVFIQNFRKSYIGDQTFSSAKLYVRLSKLVGLHDHLLVLDVLVRKLATNLKCNLEGGAVVDQTLSLLLELATGYMTGKLLLKLDTVQYIILQHTREHFRFLVDYNSSRRRTTFCYIIGSLVFMEDQDSPIKFKQAMDPFLEVLVTLESTPDEVFRNDMVKYALIGLMRDLKGIVMATTSRRAFGLFFNWLYPVHMPLLLKATEHWADTPEVTTPLLKFVAELVLNKSQRLMFDSSSPNSILLFREVSKLIVAYGSRLLSLPSQTDVYTYKYKGIWICLRIVSRALSGNYINFGVLELYGDTALTKALDVALRMMLAIPLADVVAYKKIAGAYFCILEVLLKSQIKCVLNLDTSTFIYLVKALESGLKVVDSNVTSQCAAAVDCLATYYFDHVIMGDSPTSPTTHNLARHISDCPDVFPQLLKCLFEIVLLENTANHWSLSRPILSLILVTKENFENLKVQIMASQTLDRQQHLQQSFEGLMADITQSLGPKNRDRFTQNFARFRNEFLAR